MKKKNVMFFCIVLTIWCNQSFGQVGMDDHSKYWYYRDRFLKDFIRIGEDNNLNGPATGFSIPAGKTHHEVADIYNPNNGKFKIHWGDATSDLGYYVAILATEYKLLNQRNQPTDKVLQELFFAMKAFERLDYKAEGLVFPSLTNFQYPGDQNGFFIRDDVSEPWVQSQFGTSLTTVGQSDYMNYLWKKNTLGMTGNPRTSMYMSADQISALFLGFAMVKKCVGGVSFNGYNFVGQAEDFTDKIATYLMNNNYNALIPNSTISGGPNYPAYAGPGEDIQMFYAYAIAKAAEKITGKSYLKSPTGLLSNPVLFPSEALWSTLPVNMWTVSADYSRHLITLLAAVGDSWHCGLDVNKTTTTWTLPLPCWPKVWKICPKTFSFNSYCYVAKPCLIPLIPPVSICVPLVPLPPIRVNVTGAALSNIGVNHHIEISPMIYKYLWNKTAINSGDDQTIHDYNRDAINDAPCDGIRFRPADNVNDLGASGWRSSFRWSRADWAKNGNAAPYSLGSNPSQYEIDQAALYNQLGVVQGSGKFAGLDFMLEYNLYNLIYKSKIQNVPNALDYVNEKDYIINNGQVNNAFGFNHGHINGNLSEYKGFNSIVAGNTTLNNTGNVLFKAGSTLELNAGFEVPVGAKFEALIANPWTCNSNGYNRTTADSINIETLDTDSLDQQQQASLQAELDSVYAASMPLIEQGMVEKERMTYIPLDTYLSNCNGFASGRVAATSPKRENTSSQFVIYPNPTENSFTLRFLLEKEQVVSFSIMDIYGKNSLVLLKEEKLNEGSHEIKLDISKLSNGIYIGMLNLEKAALTKRIIKLNK